jgi:drug/metabolite transporter (DMT)-like permease
MSKLANLAAAGTVVLWASAFPAITVADRGLGPAGLAVARLGVASAALAVVALVAALLRLRRPAVEEGRTALGVGGTAAEVGGTALGVGRTALGVGGTAAGVGRPALGVRIPAGRDLPLIMVCGLAGMTGYQLLLNAGERVVPAGTASLLVATAPVYSSLLAVAFLGERAGRRRWAGSAIALAGTALIAASHGLGFGVSALVVLAAAVLQAIFHAAQKPLLARYTSFEVTAYAMWAGTVFILPWTGSLLRTLLPGPGPGGAAIGAAVFLGLAPSAAGFVLWAYAMARMDVGRVTLSLYLVPAVAIVISLAWLGQVPSPVELAGGAIALAGVMLARGTRGDGGSHGVGDSRVAAGDEDGGDGQGGGGPGQHDQQGPGGGEQARRRVQRADLLGRLQQREPADPAAPRRRQQARDGGHRDHRDGGGDAARGVPGERAEGQAEQGAYAQQQAGA